jgi:hypothetical protein
MSSKKDSKKARLLKGAYKYRVPPSVTDVLIEKYLVALDCPRALAVLILYRNGEHEQIANLEYNPLHYLTVVQNRDSYAATKFLSKFPGLKLGYDLDEVAVRKFEAFELLCKETNSRFRNPNSDPLYRGQNVWLHHAVRRKISDILGEFEFNEVISMADWGPGATSLIKRVEASATEKFQREAGVTRDLFSLFPLEVLKDYYPLWALQLEKSGYPDYQIGNRVVTVPKDATSNRIIAIEPGINLWFQLGVGCLIERRLRRVGIDISDQTRNQRLAKAGSVDSSLATVDFSSASDSIAYELVRDLIPPEWFDFLDITRSHFGTLDGKMVRWEKFSSMGNGFTFPLETLIFYAVAWACAKYTGSDTSVVSVYGDDVVVPTTAFKCLSELMSFYGFKINLKKSYSTTPFRESCGSHYYSGIDVKPYYLRDGISSLLSVYRTANGIRRLAHRFGGNTFCDARFRTPYDLLVQKIPKGLRLRVSEGFGDSGLISNFDEAVPSRAVDGIEGYHFTAIAEVGKTYEDDRVGLLLAHLWALPMSEWREIAALEYQPKHNSLVAEKRLRDRVDGNLVHLPGQVWLTITSCLVPQWVDLGPWF